MSFKIKFLVVILVLISFTTYAQSSSNLDCFTIVVGNQASTDGSVLVAHNEDDHGKQIVNLYKTPPLTHSGNDSIIFANEGKIEQVEKTNGFFWIELPGMKVADSYINDKGVVITSNGCPSREENPDSTDGGILYWLRRLVAERASSAKEAVKLAGDLIHKYGYVSSGRTYTFADAKDAWIFCAVYGKHWVAQRVPDADIVVIPNYYTIGEVNLNDTSNFLGSPDVIDHAIESGWYNPETEGKFNFSKAYTALTSINHPGNINRIWRGINLLSKHDFPIDGELPFSFLPFKKLNIQDVMFVLRDHYEQCKLDKSDMYRLGNPHNINEATICSGSTQYSFVTQLRANMPVEIGTLTWLAYFRPGINIFSPLYLGMKEIPNQFSYNDFKSAIDIHFNPPESTFDTTNTHAYWDFVRATQIVDKNFHSSYPIIKNLNNYVENKNYREVKILEEKILEEYSSDPQKVINIVDKYSRKKLIESRSFANKIKNIISKDH